MRKIKPYEKAIMSAKDEFISIAGKMKWLDAIFSALIHFRDNPDLQSCDPKSIREAIISVALTGVSINTTAKEAYFYPQAGICRLDFTYRGLIKIATSDRAISSIRAEVVFKWDNFAFEMGSRPEIHFTPKLVLTEDEEELIQDHSRIWEIVKCAFSVARLPDGSEVLCLLPKWKLLKTWECTQKTTINERWPEEWIKKTVIRYHSKTLPNAEKLVMATSIMNDVVNDENKKSVKKKKEKPASRLMKRISK